MDELDQLWVPEIKDYRLNERHYGDCIGEAQLAVPTHVQAQPYPKPAPYHVVGPCLRISLRVPRQGEGAPLPKVHG